MEGNALRCSRAVGLPFAPIAAFRERLAAGTVDVAVTPYGSFFPKELFEPLYAFLAGGGNWVNIGGVPFAAPLARALGVASGGRLGARPRRWLHAVAIVILALGSASLARRSAPARR